MSALLLLSQPFANNISAIGRELWSLIFYNLIRRPSDKLTKKKKEERKAMTSMTLTSEMTVEWKKR